MIEQTLFLLGAPTDLHAQTAVEAAVKLHPHVAPRCAEIERVEVATHEAALRMLDRTAAPGPAAEGAATLPGVVASALLYGRLLPEPHAATGAPDARLTALRARVFVHEDTGFSRDYRSPDKRALANAVQVFFRDGTHTDRLTIEYPLGHYRRRIESVPLLFTRAEEALRIRLDEARAEEIIDLFDQPALLEAMPVDQFLDLWVD